MSYARLVMPPSSPELSRKAAIVGLGESDYGADYAAARAKAPGYEAPTVEQLCRTAFDRALADANLSPEEIDGLAGSFTFGGPEPAELAQTLGLNPQWNIRNGNIMAGPLPVVCQAIAQGKADTVAMLFCVASRAIGRQFGGMTDAGGEGMPSSYYYFHPWGWSSQAAHWALMYSHYMAAYGKGADDLAAVAMQVRSHAAHQPNSVMRTPMTRDAYLASRWITRPLRLFDICLVNDGAVCLIVRRADLAKSAAKTPVLVSGWGESKVTANKLHAMVREGLGVQMQASLAQALAMAGLSHADIGHYEGYDASSFHLANQLEGFGFTPRGTALDFCADGQMTLGGRTPTNMAGGNLSNSYMQGWGLVAEAVRQQRGESPLQIPGLKASMSAVVQTDQSHPLIFEAA
ncbi:MAG: hypothetical protein KGN34_07375 [Sphingomonadales bacterium]|nr:hypothetical protein [Sphingomonadales bacterium]